MRTRDPRPSPSRPRPVPRLVFAVLLAIAWISAGCATLQQLAALRHVDFRIKGVSDVSVAGIGLAGVRSLDDLGLIDATRLTAAYVDGDVPLALRVDIEATNPETNSVSARLLAMDWTLLLNGRETVSGGLPQAYELAPGTPTIIPLDIELNVVRFFSESLEDVVSLAVGVAGLGGRSTEVQLRATPTVDTPIGAMNWPEPIMIVKTDVGS